jgi:hypothetical protein
MNNKAVAYAGGFAFLSILCLLISAFGVWLEGWAILFVSFPAVLLTGAIFELAWGCFRDSKN